MTMRRQRGFCSRSIFNLSLRPGRCRMRDLIRIGTRRSALARWQTDYVAEKLQTAWPEARIEIEVIVTQGDRVQDTPLPLIGGKGVFTAELEQALHNGS